MSCGNGINDCENPNMLSCENPCRATVGNTAACESLPSQIENFTTQFFGTVQKTEINGEVVWTLPCSLDVGLPANPRAADEGLACYFLRLFMDGITGLKGDPGNPGAPGTPGFNAFTVTLASFVQPTLSNPNLNIFTAYNPAVLDGEYIFIQSSGWYLINSTDGNGTLFLTLQAAIPGASGTITAGKLAVPCGPPGLSIVGPQGPQGTKGDQGNPGPSYTATNDFFYDDSGGTDYPLTQISAPVTFVNSAAAVLLPVAGTYMVTAIVGWEVAPAQSPSSTDAVFFKLRNTSVGADIAGSAKTRVDLVTSPNGQLTLQAIITTIAPNQTIALYAHTSSAEDFVLPFEQTTITYVRLS